MGDLKPPQQMRDGPAAMMVNCLACGDRWIAREALFDGHKGSFRRDPLSLYIWCRKCDAHSAIASVDIPTN
jgi:hypothetical protein